MGIITEAVPLHDVRDVDAFVNGAINATGLGLRADEREELEAASILILYELAEEWDGRGRFVGYAGRYFGGRILSEWHRQHRGEHVRPHRGDWTYREVSRLDTLAGAREVARVAYRPAARRVLVVV